VVGSEKGPPEWSSMTTTLEHPTDTIRADLRGCGNTSDGPPMCTKTGPKRRPAAPRRCPAPKRLPACGMHSDRHTRRGAVEVQQGQRARDDRHLARRLRGPRVVAGHVRDLHVDPVAQFPRHEARHLGIHHPQRSDNGPLEPRLAQVHGDQPRARRQDLHRQQQRVEQVPLGEVSTRRDQQIRTARGWLPDGAGSVRASRSTPRR